MAVAVAVLVAVVLVAGTGLLLLRSRGRARGDAAERAVLSERERDAAQDRATQAHPDAVRDWMRP